MQLVVNSKEHDLFSSEVAEGVIGYNFYSVMGSYHGRFAVGETGYPRCNYKIVINVNDKEIELEMNENLYKLNDGKYFIGKEI